MINGKKFNSEVRRPRVLVTPLNWGLGHATRCIPIINQLIAQDCEIIIAADEALNFLLKKEFPQAVFLPFGGYKVKYSRKSKWLAVKLMLQFPGIILSAWQENAWLKRAINKYQVDAVISDNRLGAYNKTIPCVYITHQLLIKTGNKVSEKIAQKIHYHFIKKYAYCWVPDFADQGLAGDLSHPANKPSNVLHIGPLSRFKKIPDLTEKYDLLISLSGPEPQRTIFEKMVLSQLTTYQKNVLLVRGLPGETSKPVTNIQSMEIVNHLSSPELNVAFQQSRMIISRSGYSTIMDLIKIDKNAVLVATPGQTEQEYLADYLMKKKYFYSVRQDNFSLEEAIDRASSFQLMRPEHPEESYRKVVDEFVHSMRR